MLKAFMIGCLSLAIIDVRSDVQATIKKMALISTVLSDIAIDSPPLVLLKSYFLQQLRQRHTVTLQSPDGYDGSQIVGAVSGGGESESKGPEIESDSKTAATDDQQVRYFGLLDLVLSIDLQARASGFVMFHSCGKACCERMPRTF